MSAWGNMLARGQSFDHSKIDHSGNSPQPYDARKVLTTIVTKYPIIADKLVEYLNRFDETEKLLGYRDRFYDVFNGSSFEESFVIALRHFQNMPGEYFPSDYGQFYAAELLVSAFPATSSKFLATLIVQAKDNNWNEGDSRVRSKLLQLSTMASVFFNYDNRADITLQTILLKSNIQSVRTASCAALHSSLYINYVVKRDIDEVLKVIQTNLHIDEYCMFLAYFISNLQLTHREDKDKEVLQNKLFKKLLTDFAGDKYFVNRIVRILGGWLEYDRSIFVTNNFLEPLCQMHKITPEDACNVWHEVFLRKIRYDDQYKNNGSDDHADNFSSTTDIELTVALINTFLLLPPEYQSSFILPWITEVDTMWSIVNQPFSNNRNHNQSAIRLFWVDFIIKTVDEAASLSDDAAKITTNFLDKHASEFALINNYVRSKQHLGIRDIESKVRINHLDK